MIKQLKELCIKTEQGSNLSECLNKYTKTQIKNILDLYGGKVASAAKKGDDRCCGGSDKGKRGSLFRKR